MGPELSGCQNQYPGPVADIILQALMLGRRSFYAPSSGKVAAEALDEFYQWFGDLRRRIERAIRDLSIGTGFEFPLTHEIWARLGLHSKVGRLEVPARIYIGKASRQLSARMRKCGRRQPSDERRS